MDSSQSRWPKKTYATYSIIAYFQTAFYFLPRKKKTFNKIEILFILLFFNFPYTIYRVIRRLQRFYELYMRF